MTAKKKKSRIKLNPAKVRAIRVLYFDKGWSQRRIAKKYGVSRSCVYGVTSGESWYNVEVC